jgi:hypothetical protein
MNYAAEMGSCAMTHILSFVKIGSGIQKLIRGDTHRDTQTGRSHKPLFRKLG